MGYNTPVSEHESNNWTIWGCTFITGIVIIVISILIYNYQCHVLTNQEVIAGKDPIAAACAHNTQATGVKCEDLVRNHN